MRPFHTDTGAIIEKFYDLIRVLSESAPGIVFIFFVFLSAAPYMKCMFAFSWFVKQSISSEIHGRNDVECLCAFIEKRPLAVHRLTMHCMTKSAYLSMFYHSLKFDLRVLNHPVYNKYYILYIVQYYSITYMFYYIPYIYSPLFFAFQINY